MDVNVGDIRFDEKGLVPAVSQDILTGRVLMLAYMNREALERTISTGRAHYYSRSRRRLWMKGETSGNVQEVESIYYDCDGDTLLLMVRQKGHPCHTGKKTCFFRTIDGREEMPETPHVLGELYRVLVERKSASPERSYVADLYEKGIERIVEKVREEAGEVVDAVEKGRNELIHEICDLWFHTMVLMCYRDIGLDEVFGEFARRFGISGIEEKERRKKGQ